MPQSAHNPLSKSEYFQAKALHYHLSDAYPSSDCISQLLMQMSARKINIPAKLAIRVLYKLNSALVSFVQVRN